MSCQGEVLDSLLENSTTQLTLSSQMSIPASISMPATLSTPDTFDDDEPLDGEISERDSMTTDI